MSRGAIVRAGDPWCALDALQPLQTRDGSAANPVEMLERIVVAHDHLLITIAGTADGDGQPQKIKIAWSIKARDSATVVEGDDGSESAHNQSLIQSIVRAHGWIRSLQEGAYQSIEQLAEADVSTPRRFAKYFGWLFSHRKSHQPSWKAGNRRGSPWRKFRSCSRYPGRNTDPCLADFGGSP